MMELDFIQVTYFLIAALIVGFSKTSVGGMSILAVLLMALAFPGKASPGILLPMLIAADIFAVIYYRRSCQWKIILKVFPLVAIGVGVGYFVTDIIPVEIFEIALGVVILIMLLFQIFLERGKLDISDSRIFTVIAGLSAGVATMMANAAGPIFGVYLLQMGLPKKEFVGTRSWFFLLINLFKIPFSAQLGLITADTLNLNLYSLPVIATGAVLGYLFLKMINLDIFKLLIRTSVLVAAVRLIFF